MSLPLLKLPVGICATPFTSASASSTVQGEGTPLTSKLMVTEAVPLAVHGPTVTLVMVTVTGQQLVEMGSEMAGQTIHHHVTRRAVDPLQLCREVTDGVGVRRFSEVVGVAPGAGGGGAGRGHLKDGARGSVAVVPSVAPLLLPLGTAMVEDKA